MDIFFEKQGDRSFCRVLLPHNTPCISTTTSSPTNPCPLLLLLPLQLHCRCRHWASNAILQRHSALVRGEMFVLTRPAAITASSIPVRVLHSFRFASRHVFLLFSSYFRRCLYISRIFIIPLLSLHYSKNMSVFFYVNNKKKKSDIELYDIYI